MKHLIKQGRQWFGNGLIIGMLTGFSFVCTGAILGTDLTQPLFQWLQQQNILFPRR